MRYKVAFPILLNFWTTITHKQMLPADVFVGYRTGASWHFMNTDDYRTWGFYLCNSVRQKGMSLFMASQSITWIESIRALALRDVTSFQASLSSFRRRLARTGHLGDHRPSSSAWDCIQPPGVAWHRECWRSHQAGARKGWQCVPLGTLPFLLCHWHIPQCWCLQIPNKRDAGQLPCYAGGGKENAW